MTLFDANKNGNMDRCEDATFLNMLGNTEEYAKKYSHNVPHAAAKRRCDQIFNPLYE